MDESPTETETTYTFRGAVWSKISIEERTAGLVEEDDRVLLIGADTLTVAPRDGDTVTVGGETLRVKAVKTTQPADVPLLYRLILTN